MEPVKGILIGSSLRTVSVCQKSRLRIFFSSSSLRPRQNLSVDILWASNERLPQPYVELAISVRIKLLDDLFLRVVSKVDGQTDRWTDCIHCDNSAYKTSQGVGIHEPERTLESKTRGTCRS
jgi:hypothetical protein